MRAIGLVKVELVDQADHELGECQIFVEAFVGDVEEGFAAGILEGIEVFGKKGGDGTVEEGGVIGDAVDGFAVGDGFGELLRGDIFVVDLSYRRLRLGCPSCRRIPCGCGEGRR